MNDDSIQHALRTVNLSQYFTSSDLERPIERWEKAGCPDLTSQVAILVTEDARKEVVRVTVWNTPAIAFPSYSGCKILELLDRLAQQLGLALTETEPNLYSMETIADPVRLNSLTTELHETKATLAVTCAHLKDKELVVECVLAELEMAEAAFHQQGEKLQGEIDSLTEDNCYIRKDREHWEEELELLDMTIAQLRNKVTEQADTIRVHLKNINGLRASLFHDCENYRKEISKREVIIAIIDKKLNKMTSERQHLLTAPWWTRLKWAFRRKRQMLL